MPYSTGINPEPKAEECEQHRSRINLNKRTPSPEWSAQCNNTLLLELSQRNELTMDDIINCYRPECEHGAYKSKQCYTLGSRSQQVKWCWCSSETGVSIADTLSIQQSTEPSYDCSKSTHTAYIHI